MLLSALSFSYLLAAYVVNGIDQCPYLKEGIVPLRVEEKSNYVIDLFNGALLFTYAIDKCTAIDLVPGSWYKYECTESKDGIWSVSKTKYTDSACTTESKDKSTDAVYKEGRKTGELGYFECTGSNNFVQVEISVESDCSGSRGVAAGLGGCTHNTPLLTEFYCNNSQALVQFYVDPASLTTTEEPETTETWSSTEDWTTTASALVCNPHLYCNSWSFVSGCKPVGAITLKKTTVPIYGKLDQCYIAPETVETTSTADNGKGNHSAASSLFVITNLAVALVATLFSLF